MRILNQDKTKELNEYDIDLTRGHLVADKIFVQHHEAVLPVEEQGHYETIAEYPNGGKDVKWVVDTPAVKAKEAYDEYEDVQVYIPYTSEELKERLREKRETECFPYINRGDLWYVKLSFGERAELDAWYKAWLNVTVTLEVPQRPNWLK